MRYPLVLCLITCIFSNISCHYYSLLARDYQPVGLTPSQTLKVPDYNSSTCLKTACATYCDLDNLCLSFAVAPAQSMCTCLLYNSLVSDFSGRFIGYAANSLYYGVFGYDCFESSCYTLHQDVAVIWPVATAYCESLGSHLLATETIQEYNYTRSLIQEIIKDRQYLFWIDLVGNSSNHWWWSHNSQPLTFDQWGNYEPNLVSIEQCVMIVGRLASGSHHWNNMRCTTSTAVICETQGKPAPQP